MDGMPPNETELVRTMCVGTRFDVEEQLAILASLPSGPREETLRRLGAVQDYMKLHDPDTDDARRAAEGLGVGLSSFYRLVHRARDLGPVSGLARWRKQRTLPSMHRDGLTPELDRVLRRILGQNPEVRPKAAIEMVAAAALAEGLATPSNATVQRRLNALRNGVRPRHLLAGRSIVLEQNLVTRDEHRPAWVTILLDEDTGLILAGGADADPDGSLEAAINNTRPRIASLVRKGVPFTPTLACMSARLSRDLSQWTERWLDFANKRYGEIAFRLEPAPSARMTTVLGAALAVREVRPDGFLVVDHDIDVQHAANVWNDTILGSGKPRSKTEDDQGKRLLEVLSTLSDDAIKIVQRRMTA